jgi:hypothetical protein
VTERRDTGSPVPGRHSTDIRGTEVVGHGVDSHEGDSVPYEGDSI